MIKTKLLEELRTRALCVCVCVGGGKGTDRRNTVRFFAMSPTLIKRLKSTSLLSRETVLSGLGVHHSQFISLENSYVQFGAYSFLETERQDWSRCG